MGVGHGEGSVLEFKNGRFQWRADQPSGVVVKITRQGLQVGCKIVSWEAWDELKRLVGDM